MFESRGIQICEEAVKALKSVSNDSFLHFAVSILDICDSVLSFADSLLLCFYLYSLIPVELFVKPL